MKNLFVLSHGRQTAQNISKDMASIFGEFINVKPICVEDGLFDIDFDNALVLDTGKWMEDLDTSSMIPKETRCIKSRRVVDFSRLHELMDLPEGSDILLVNDHQKTTDIAIKQLMELGLGHVNFYPFYPGIKTYRKLSTAVTPGEAHLVPDCVKTTIDIGTRLIDLTTIVEVADALGILDEVAPTLSTGYVRDMFGLVKNYSKAAKDASEMRDTFQALADHSSSGIVYVDENRNIMMINKAFYRMAGKLVEDIIGQPVGSVIPQIQEVFEAPMQKHIVKVFDRECVIDASDVKLKSGQAGMIFNIEDADAIQRMEHELRRKNRASMHTAKYRFSDIHTESQVMVKTLDLAKRVATSEATILIQGESGTGKELLAQAIHNRSSRKGGPFVPVNFAALPETLIESELFGYEEGAFTGARKGGAPGLFEAAHGGTLFLDEIGDAPLSFQTRLLRVLQEKQIRRVGGRSQIPVDVRVIAATNRNLNELVAGGQFRQDLYYRLCVLPIEVPSLRDRLEDIPLLLKMHMETIQMNKAELEDYLSADALAYLKAYDWPGNIRQLANLAEYLSHVVEAGYPISINELPLIVRESGKDSEDSLVSTVMGAEMKWLIQALDEHGPIGRRGLEQIASEADLGLTEGQIRSLLQEAGEKELVVLGKGRGGSHLTPLGKKVASKL